MKIAHTHTSFLKYYNKYANSCSPRENAFVELKSSWLFGSNIIFCGRSDEWLTK